MRSRFWQKFNTEIDSKRSVCVDVVHVKLEEHKHSSDRGFCLGVDILFEKNLTRIWQGDKVYAFGVDTSFTFQFQFLQNCPSSFSKFVFRSQSHRQTHRMGHSYQRVENKSRRISFSLDTIGWARCARIYLFICWKCAVFFLDSCFLLRSFHKKKQIN